MTIKKRHLFDQLQRFTEIRKYMMLIAKEKKNYHNILIESALGRYKDPVDRKQHQLVEARMQEPYITLHMSLKRTLRKHKDMKKLRAQQQRDAEKQAAENDYAESDKPLDVMRLKT